MSGKIFFVWILVSLAALTTSVALPAYATAALDAEERFRSANLPMIFEPNAGQANNLVKFLSRGRGYTLFLTENEAILSLAGGQVDGGSLHIKLLDSNQKPTVTGRDRLPGVSNYFTGRDPSKWKTGIPHFSSVHYDTVYEGIDLDFYGNAEGRLEYDFVIAPGADPTRIALGFEGADKIEIKEGGDLVAHLPNGEIRFLAPFIYQNRGAERQRIEGGYVLEDGRLQFQLAEYDPSRPLIIDPILAYSTLFGGSGSEQNIRDVAVDSDGNILLAGQTDSLDLPLLNPVQDACVETDDRSGCDDAFVAKLNSDGSTLLYSTYLGSSSGDDARGVAVDSLGNAYVAGSTGSSDATPSVLFPTTPGAFQTQPTANVASYFVRLGTTGGLDYATYVDGSRHEFAWDIAVREFTEDTEKKVQAVIVGETASDDFPTTQDALDQACGDDLDLFDCDFVVGDVFMVIIDPQGNGSQDLVYGTFLGGTDDDRGFGVSTDQYGLVYMTGMTKSSDFPFTVSAIQDELLGLDSSAFLTVVDPRLSGDGSLKYSTYLGGDDGGSIGWDVEVDKDFCDSSSCQVYLTGAAQADTFPTTSDAAVPFPVLGLDVFVTVIDTVQGTLDYSSYFGGFLPNIAIGPQGEAFLAGEVVGTIPIRGAIQSENMGSTDGFIAVLDPGVVLQEGQNGLDQGLLFGTYFGGSNTDRIGGIAADASGNLYVTGQSFSADFPTTESAFQTELRTAETSKKGRPFQTQGDPDPDAFAVKIEGPFDCRIEAQSDCSEEVAALTPKQVATADAYEMAEGGELNVLPPGVLENDDDFADDDRFVRDHTDPVNGVVVMHEDENGIRTGGFTYTPSSEFSGTDAFMYTVSDGQALDATIVKITVTSVNDPPLAVDDNYTGAAAGSEFVVSAPGVLANDSDPENDSLTAKLVSGPSFGSIDLKADGAFTYTPPNKDFSGTDTFTYRANDGLVYSNEEALVSIDVRTNPIHVGNLEVRKRKEGGTWGATLWIRVHDRSHNVVPDVTVSGRWLGTSGDEFEKSDCVTGNGTLHFADTNESWEGGFCKVWIEGIPNKIASITYSIVSLTHNELNYNASGNHDPEGDISSGGTSITISR